MTVAAPLPEAALLRGSLGVAHGVTLRAGGVSAPPFDTLNLGASVGDDPAAVAENRRRAAAAFGRSPEWVMRADQVHGATVRVASAAAIGADADALISDDPDWVLAVGAADCLPILIHDTRTGAVAAVHAGWRGAVAGVASASVARLTQKYGSAPGDLDVWFGPAIRGPCYQVGPEVIDAVVASGGDERTGTWWPDGGEGDRFRLDVPAFVRAQLVTVGVDAARIVDSGVCTHCDPSCFSHRRDRGQTGRHWAMIRAGPANSRG